MAAFLASLDAQFRKGIEGGLPDETQVVYVSPLKALSNDIRKNLQEPLSGIRELLKEQGHDIDVRAEVRTGDTTPAQRQALVDAGLVEANGKEARSRGRKKKEIERESRSSD